MREWSDGGICVDERMVEEHGGCLCVACCFEVLICEQGVQSGDALRPGQESRGERLQELQRRFWIGHSISEPREGRCQLCELVTSELDLRQIESLYECRDVWQEDRCIIRRAC